MTIGAIIIWDLPDGRQPAKQRRRSRSPGARDPQFVFGGERRFRHKRERKSYAYLKRSIPPACGQSSGSTAERRLSRTGCSYAWGVTQEQDVGVVGMTDGAHRRDATKDWDIYRRERKGRRVHRVKFRNSNFGIRIFPAASCVRGETSDLLSPLKQSS